MNIAICDDERIFRDTLEQAIRAQLKICSIRQFVCGEDLLREAADFDVIFLDIEMPGLNGMQTAEMIRKLSKEIRIVFLTSHGEFVHDAFRVRAFRYLSKPIEPSTLQETLRLTQLIRSPISSVAELSKDRLLRKARG